MLNKFNSNFLYLFPVMYFFGPLFLEAIFLIFVILNFKSIKLDDLIIEIKKYSLFLLFFLFIALTSLFSNYDISIFKGIAYLRFFIYFMFLNLLIPYNSDSISKFSKSALIICLVLICYNIYQVTFQFGLDEHRTTIPFRFEPISGSFITFFSPFVISYICWNYNNKKFNLLASLILILIISAGCLISGERINTILFFSVFFIFTFFKSKKILFSYIAICFLSIGTILMISSINSQGNKTETFKIYDNKKLDNRITYLINRYDGFYHRLFVQGLKDTYWGHHYYAALNIWKENKLTGTGIKSFRKECKKFISKKEYACSTHPHNMYLELMSEIGSIGLILFLIPILYLFYKSFRGITSLKKDSFNSFLLVYLLIYLMIFLFPYKTFGSFFNNINSFGFWIIIFFINHVQKYNLNNEKK